MNRSTSCLRVPFSAWCTCSWTCEYLRIYRTASLRRQCHLSCPSSKTWACTPCPEVSSLYTRHTRKKNLSTRTSKRVPHVCTIRARRGLTSLCGWEAVLSSWCGRDMNEPCKHDPKPHDDYCTGIPLWIYRYLEATGTRSILRLYILGGWRQWVQGWIESCHNSIHPG